MPRLIIVTGLPCTGKTTLARRLAVFFDLPLIYKDAIKEGLFDLFESGSLSRSQALSRLTYQVIFHLLAEYLEAGESLVVESNFTRPEHTRMFLDLMREHPFEPRQVLCYARGETLIDRFRRRTRHAGHMDKLLYYELEAELLTGRCQPLDIGGRLVEVDTSDFEQVDYEKIFDAVGTGSFIDNSGFDNSGLVLLCRRGISGRPGPYLPGLPRIGGKPRLPRNG